MLHRMPTFPATRTKIVALAARGRAPAIYNLREFADIGDPLGSRPGIRDAYDRAAPFADRTRARVIPGDRPHEQSTSFAPAIPVAATRPPGVDAPPSRPAPVHRTAP
jgi:hypothetical protein